MNHRWKDNKCVRCGVKRGKCYAETWTHVAGWAFYKNSKRKKLIDAFSFDGENWEADKPECKILNEVPCAQEKVCEHKNSSTNYTGEFGWCRDCQKWIVKSKLDAEQILS